MVLEYRRSCQGISEPSPCGWRDCGRLTVGMDYSKLNTTILLLFLKGNGGPRKRNMLRINKKIEYALISLRHMQNSQRVTARDLAQRYGISYELLAKVLQQLAQEGIITSVQGPKGGYILPDGLDELSFLALYESLVGTFIFAECEGNSCEHTADCTIQNAVAFLGNRMRNVLNEISVYELLLKEE